VKETILLASALYLAAYHACSFESISFVGPVLKRENKLFETAAVQSCVERGRGEGISPWMQSSSLVIKIAYR
jgi:hypothetical protein